MRKLTLYEILGIRESATLEEIKVAYRALALKFHPDRHTDPQKKAKVQETFKVIAYAHHVLSDPKKRREYDVLLARHRNPQPAFQFVVYMSGWQYGGTNTTETTTVTGGW